MNKNINTFANQAEYAQHTSSIKTPSVTYIKDSDTVEYKIQYHEPTEDKTKAQVGDIVFFNDMIFTKELQGDTILYMDPKDPRINMMLKNDPVYGVVVIPTNHTSDGSVRVVSVNFMDIDGDKQLYWGPYNDTVDMDTSDEIVIIVPGTTTVATSSFGYFPTNYHKVQTLNNPDDVVTNWDFYAVNNEKECPSPYTNNGETNAQYNTSGSVTAFGLNGLANTNAILDKSTLGEAGHENPVNSINAGFYPAAEVCSVYYADDEKVQSSESGKFYLPSITELAYLYARYELIDLSRRIAGGESATDKYLWSSSLSNSNDAWYLDLYLNGNFGSCASYGKASNCYVLAFVAF